MTRRQRDLLWAIVKWPGWVVVGVAISGAVYATTLRGEVQEVKDKIIPLAEIRRELDSLRIEQRHLTETVGLMSGTVDEIRHLLARPFRRRTGGTQADLLR